MGNNSRVVLKLKYMLLVLAVFVMGLAMGVRSALAQSGGGYELGWSNVGAAGTTGGGAYTLDSSVGQPDAGTVSGGSYALSGGFFASPGVINILLERVYLPLVRR